MPKFHLYQNRRLYDPRKWTGERLPYFAPEIQYTTAVQPHPVIFLTSIVDKTLDQSAFYWYLCHGENILNGRGGVIPSYRANSALAKRSLATLAGLSDMCYYLTAVNQVQKLPAPHLVILDKKVSRYLWDEADRPFLNEWLKNDAILADALYNITTAYYQGVVKEILVKKNPPAGQFYIQQVCAALFMTMKRMHHYPGKRVRTRLPSYLIQLANYTKRDLHERGIFSRMYSTGDDKFLHWVLEKYGDIDGLEVIAADEGEENLPEIITQP